MSGYDLWVDFTRMADDGRLRTRQRNARPGFVPIVGTHVIVGCEDADSAGPRSCRSTTGTGSRCKCFLAPSTRTAAS